MLMGRKMCKNCDCAVTTADEVNWHHFSKKHDNKCKCRQPEFREIKWKKRNLD